MEDEEKMGILVEEIKQEVLLEETDEEYSNLLFEEDLKLESEEIKEETENEIASEPPDLKPEKIQCDLCSATQENLKSFDIHEERLVVMIESVINGILTEDDAHLILSKADNLRICSDHFSTAIHGICAFLDVPNPWDFLKSHFIRNLMETVNLLNPVLKIYELSEILCRFSFAHDINFEEKEENNETPQLPFKRYGCTFCGKIRIDQHIKLIESDDEKLIIMTGFALNRMFPMERIEQLYKKQSLALCHDHFPTIIQLIFVFPGIENYDEIPMPEVMNELMTTVFSIRHEFMNAVDFWRIFREFVAKYSGDSMSQSLKIPENNHCSICSLSKSLVIVTSLEEKLVIIIGCVIKGSLTENRAKELLTEDLSICKDHFSGLFNGILDCLNIPNINVIPSPKLMQYLMDSVNKLDNRCSIEEFWNYLNSFASKYKNLLENHSFIRKCSICSRSEHECSMKAVTTENDKLIISIAQFIDKKLSVQQAQDFLNSNHLICDAHFPSISKTLFKCLHINNSSELPSSQLMFSLMVTVNSFREKCSAPEFWNILKSFITNYEIEEITTEEIPVQKIEREVHPCSLCPNLSFETKEITSDDAKLVIMTGTVLRQELNIFQAQMFMNQKLIICESHIPKIIDRICRGLGVQNPETIPKATMLRNVMFIVKYLRPDCHQFWQIFSEFYWENMTISEQSRLSSYSRPQKIGKRQFRDPCAVCSKVGERDMKIVRIYEQKLIFMVRCLLRGEKRLVDARFFLGENIVAPVCPSHFHESLVEIYRVLNVEFPRTRGLHSPKLLDKLMKTVNLIVPDIKAYHFLSFLRKFASRNRLLICEAEKEQKPINRCKLCDKFLDETYREFSENEKLIVLIGLILQGHFTMKFAQEIMENESIVFICKSHFGPLINEIFNFLSIENALKMDQFSTNRMNILMTTVKSLDSKIIDSAHFCWILFKFHTKFLL